jgi:hypothetical protein
VTALLAEISPQTGRLTLFSCGHPSAMLIRTGLISAGLNSAGLNSAGLIEAGAAGSVQALDVPSPAPALGLMTLGSATPGPATPGLTTPGDQSRASITVDLQPDDQVLFYTDGVTEARDGSREFYPLPERLAKLSASQDSEDGGGAAGLLEGLRQDLLRHVGAPLDDDAAMLLVRAPAAWPASRRALGRPVAAR